MKEIIKGQEVLFDECDAVLFYSRKWFLCPKPHGTYLAGSFLLTDRSKWTHEYFHIMALGKIYDGLVIDHKNGNPLDNRRSNLRYVPPMINALNTNKSPGVDFMKKLGLWRARIVIGGKEKYLGIFKTREEALVVRNEYFETHFPGVRNQ
jgi:hypothetical protein